MGDGGAICELGIELVIFGMGDMEIGLTPRIDPLGKAVGDALRERFDMGRPREYDLWAVRSRRCAHRFVDGDDVREALQGMKGGAFETYDGDARIFYELFDIELAVIVLLVFQRGEGPDA